MIESKKRGRPLGSVQQSRAETCQRAQVINTQPSIDPADIRWSADVISCKRCSSFFYVLYPQEYESSIAKAMNNLYDLSNKCVHPLYETIEFNPRELTQLLYQKRIKHNFT